MKTIVTLLFIVLSFSSAQEKYIPEYMCEVPAKNRQELSDVMNTIHKLIEDNSYQKVENKKLFMGFMEGLRIALNDKYIQYLDKKAYKYIDQGKFQGVGIMIGFEKNILKIISPIAGGPADKAGLKAGDAILGINAKLWKQKKTLAERVKQLRGPVGSKISLLIKRPGVEKVMGVTVVREEFSVRQLFHRLLSKEIGYIQVKQFSKGIAKEFQDACKFFVDNKIKGALIDLRNCPGGHLDEVVKIADGLLSEGTIVQIKRKDGAEELKSVAGVWIDIPIVVLVNGQTASAAEILVGALKERGRAILVGTKTFGKGTIQKLYPIKDGALKLTIGVYLTPKGVAVERRGIQPNIVIAAAKDKKTGRDPQWEKGIALIQALAALKEHK